MTEGRGVQSSLQRHRGIELKRSLKVFGRKGDHGDSGIVAHSPVFPNGSFGNDQKIIGLKLYILQIDSESHPTCQTKNRNRKGEFDRIIGKIPLRILLFRGFIEIVDQNKILIQIDCYIFCGQSNQIQIPINLFHVNDFNLSGNKFSY